MARWPMTRLEETPEVEQNGAGGEQQKRGKRAARLAMEDAREEKAAEDRGDGDSGGGAAPASIGQVPRHRSGASASYPGKSKQRNAALREMEGRSG